MRGEYYYATYLANAKFGMWNVIPDSDWVNVRKIIAQINIKF